MKTQFSLLIALFGCVVTLALPARAQVQTFETISASSGSVTAFTTGKALTQTFSSLTLVQSMTYRFASASPAHFSGTTLNAYFTEWNPTTNTSVGSALLSTSITIPNYASFADFGGEFDFYRGFDYQFTLNQVTDPSKTYAMVLVGTSPTTIGLLNIDNADLFAYGSNSYRQGVASFSSLATAATTLSPGLDWGFSQIAVVTYSATPVPEPQTAAAVLAVMFVAGLVGRRLWLQRRATTPQAIGA